jgi:hypothetical protein
MQADCCAGCAGNVVVENFQELQPGFISNPVPFAGNPALGNYDHLLVRSADAFWRCWRERRLYVGNTSFNAGSNPTTLTLAAPQRYFGFWWLAGDPKNLLSFYSGNTLIETFPSSVVVNFINAQANKSEYFGNPNNGQNTGQPYAFLNFYADPSNPGLTFDRIVFSSTETGFGFEMNNHTLATFYEDISGSDIDPTTPIDLGRDPNSSDTMGVEGSDSTPD